MQRNREPDLIGTLARSNEDGAELCPVVKSLHLVGNEKRLVIIRYLLDRPMRFSELNKFGLDSKTLSRALKGLENSGIVNRQIISTRPFSVQYSLTEKGRQLGPVIDSLRSWAAKWVENGNGAPRVIGS